MTLVTLAGMVLVAATGLTPILVAILGACSVLVVSRAMTFHRALDALDRDVLLIVAAAIGTAERVDVDPTGFAVAVAISASASFLTPIGYQTNTIVYGLGGYRFRDYWRLGLPSTVTTAVMILVVVPRVWG